MHNAYPTNVWPLSADFVDQSGEAVNEMLLVCLVCEERDTVSAFGMISSRAAKEHHCAAVGLAGPAIRRIYWRLGLSHRKPCIPIGSVRALLHDPMVGPTGPNWRKGRDKTWEIFRYDGPLWERDSRTISGL